MQVNGLEKVVVGVDKSWFRVLRGNSGVVASVFTGGSATSDC